MNDTVYMVITPDVTKEILATFKHEIWAIEWRDKYSATSGVVPFTLPVETKYESIRYPHS